MAAAERRIAIVIGVAGSVPRKFLPGAINGARAFQGWAARQGYETVLVTDETNDVTMNLLREQILGILKASPDPIYRIILYFAGHGLIREIEEGLWLLSDWRAELRAVAVEVLKRRLTMYRPKQICIISDACRSLPADIVQADLVPDAVLGAGPNPVDMTVPFDKFIAAQDGTESFMIPGADPEDDRCLFSGVLLEGLWGQAGRSVSPFSGREPDRITGRSLAAYLLAEASARAKDYDLTLTPAVSSTFPEGEDYYFHRDAALTPPTFAPWPPKGALASMAAARDDKSGFFRDLWKSLRPQRQRHTETIELDSSPIGRGADAWPEPHDILKQLREQVHSIPVPGVNTGIVSAGDDVVDLWSGPNTPLRRIAPQAWSFEHSAALFTSLSAQTLIEYADGRFASAVALPYHFLFLARDAYGVAGALYRDTSVPTLPVAAEAALSALESGALRVDAAADFAVQLREGKHADPVLGVISAYLYDAIGDVDNIRRMASFYRDYGQAIPYDIALLGGLKATRTADGFDVDIPEIQAREPHTEAERVHAWTTCHVYPSKGVVAGLWPWMRQGWSFLDDPDDVGSALVSPELITARDGLMRSRFTTLERDAALLLRNINGLNRHAE